MSVTKKRNQEDLYNVSTYSDFELYDILDVNNPTDRELEARIVFLIRKYTNMQNKSGDQLASFFKDIYNHFFQDNEEPLENTMLVEGFTNPDIDKVNKGEITLEEFKKLIPKQNNETINNDLVNLDAIRGQAVLNDKSNDNINTTQAVGFTKQLNFTGDSLNPLLNQTIKRIVSIDSQYREDKNALSTNFSFNLSSPLKDVVSLKLYAFQIPLTWYTISNAFGSNYFYLKGNVPGLINNSNQDMFFDISAGNYDPQGLVDTVNNRIISKKQIYSDVDFGNTSVSYNKYTSLCSTNINIIKNYSENSYYLKFKFNNDPTIHDTPNSIDPSRNHSIPSFLGFNNETYYFNTLNSNFTFPNYSSETLSTDDSLKQFTITTTNSSILIVKYTSSLNEYTGLIKNYNDLLNSNTTTTTTTTNNATRTEVITIDNNGFVLFNNALNNSISTSTVNNSFIDTSFNITLSLTPTEILGQKYSRNEIVKDLTDQIANNILLSKESYISRLNLTDPSFSLYPNSYYQLKIKPERLKTNNIINSKILIVFPTELGTTNNIWTGNGSCFNFNNTINELNNIFGETPVVEQTIKYNIVNTPSILIKCTNPNFTSILNDISINVQKSPFSSGLIDVGYTLQEYIGAINSGIINATKKTPFLNGPTNQSYTYNYNYNNNSVPSYTYSYIDFETRFSLFLDIKKVFDNTMYTLDLTDSFLYNQLNLGRSTGNGGSQIPVSAGYSVNGYIKNGILNITSGTFPSSYQNKPLLISSNDPTNAFQNVEMNYYNNSYQVVDNVYYVTEESYSITGNTFLTKGNIINLSNAITVSGNTFSFSNDYINIIGNNLPICCNQLSLDSENLLLDGDNINVLGNNWVITGNTWSIDTNNNWTVNGNLYTNDVNYWQINDGNVFTITANLMARPISNIFFSGNCIEITGSSYNLIGQYFNIIGNTWNVVGNSYSFNNNNYNIIGNTFTSNANFIIDTSTVNLFGNNLSINSNQFSINTAVNINLNSNAFVISGNNYSFSNNLYNLQGNSLTIIGNTFNLNNNNISFSNNINLIGNSLIITGNTLNFENNSNYLSGNTITVTDSSFVLSSGNVNILGNTFFMNKNQLFDIGNSLVINGNVSINSSINSNLTISGNNWNIIANSFATSGNVYTITNVSTFNGNNIILPSNNNFDIKNGIIVKVSGNVIINNENTISINGNNMIINGNQGLLSAVSQSKNMNIQAVISGNVYNIGSTNININNNNFTINGNTISYSNLSQLTLSYTGSSFNVIGRNITISSRTNFTISIGLNSSTGTSYTFDGHNDVLFNSIYTTATLNGTTLNIQGIIENITGIDIVLKTSTFTIPNTYLITTGNTIVLNNNLQLPNNYGNLIIGGNTITTDGNVFTITSNNPNILYTVSGSNISVNSSVINITDISYVIGNTLLEYSNNILLNNNDTTDLMSIYNNHPSTITVTGNVYNITNSIVNSNDESILMTTENNFLLQGDILLLSGNVISYFDTISSYVINGDLNINANVSVINTVTSPEFNINDEYNISNIAGNVISLSGDIWKITGNSLSISPTTNQWILNGGNVLSINSNSFSVSLSNSILPGNLFSISGNNIVSQSNMFTISKNSFTTNDNNITFTDGNYTSVLSKTTTSVFYKIPITPVNTISMDSPGVTISSKLFQTTESGNIFSTNSNNLGITGNNLITSGLNNNYIVSGDNLSVNSNNSFFTISNGNVISTGIKYIVSEPILVNLPSQSFTVYALYTTSELPLTNLISKTSISPPTIYNGDLIMKVRPKYNNDNTNIQTFGNENDPGYTIINNTGKDIYCKDYKVLQDSLNQIITDPKNIVDSTGKTIVPTETIFLGSPIILNINTSNPNNVVIDCCLNITINKVLSNKDYSIEFIDIDFTDESIVTDIKSVSWYKNLQIKDSMINTPYSLSTSLPVSNIDKFSGNIINLDKLTGEVIIKGYNDISFNSISFAGNGDNVITFIANEDGVTSPGNENDITITIPPRDANNIRIKYSRDYLISEINSLLSKSKAKGTYLSIVQINGYNYTQIRSNVNIQYTSNDYNLIFYDTYSFVKCYIGTTSVKNVTWDSTLGWILGYRSLTIYNLSEYVNNIVNGDTGVCTNLFSYFLLCLDDFNQNYLNDGLVTITSTDTSIPLPSYANRANFICDPATHQLTYNSYTESLTQNQLYTITEIANNKNKKTSNLTRGISTANLSSGPFVQDVFAILPMKVSGLANGSIYVENSGTLQNQDRLYFGPVNIHRMSVKLVTDRGDVVDLNGANWSFSIVVEQIYKKKPG